MSKWTQLTDLMFVRKTKVRTHSAEEKVGESSPLRLEMLYEDLS